MDARGEEDKKVGPQTMCHLIAKDKVAEQHI